MYDFGLTITQLCYKCVTKAHRTIKQDIMAALDVSGLVQTC